MNDLCANCSHPKALHFKHDAYVPGTCDYGYDLCSCREYKPVDTSMIERSGTDRETAGPLLTKMLEGVDPSEQPGMITAVCTDGQHYLCSGRCVRNMSVGWHEYHYTARKCACHNPKETT